MIKITEYGSEHNNPVSVHFKYDSFGRVIEESGPAGVISCAYNDRGLLAEKRYEFSLPYRGSKKSFTVKYFYDSLDRIVKVSSPAGVYRYSYNRDGKISSLRFGKDAVVRYAYDKAGRLISNISPTSFNDSPSISFKTKVDLNLGGSCSIASSIADLSSVSIIL